MKIDLEYIKNNFNVSSDITFKYNNSQCTIFCDKIHDNNYKFFITIDTLFEEMNIQCFDTIKELFEKTIIEGDKLVDIWNKVNITIIDGFNNND